MRKLAGYLAGLLLIASAGAHEVSLIGQKLMPWTTDQIGRVLTGGSFVLPGLVVEQQGQRCLAGNRFDIDVRDDFAFDIDEPVELEVQLYLDDTARDLVVSYDGRLGRNSATDIRLPDARSGARLQTQKLLLDGARFAGFGRYGTDITIGRDGSEQLTICQIALKRSYRSPTPHGLGYLDLEIVDPASGRVPARIGIYDATGRMPFPSDSVVPLKMYESVSRVVDIREGGHPEWPTKNRTGFYTDGRYQARLPAGTYDLVVSRGPEYRVTRQSFAVRADETTPIKVSLRRWKDMPARGWYSGDNHIHYDRSSAEDDRKLLLITQGEDVRVASTLMMGNSGHTYYHPHDWRPVMGGPRDSYVLKAGQEEPRTTKRGHSLELNLLGPIRDTDRYLLYDEVFAKVHEQGGVTGYAHVMDRVDASTLYALGYRTGLALDMPFGLVDIVEVLQAAQESTNAWFEYLNLGYKLQPSAGTDCCAGLSTPYADLPGSVRSYVRVEGPLTSQGWFDGLKQGRTFVTNGPMLEFSVNGREMGSQLQLKKGDKITISAAAAMNPDIDRLRRLELVEQGSVIKTVTSREGSEALRMELQVEAKHGTWFVLKAYGRQDGFQRNVVAMSAPIYIDVDGGGFWKPAAVTEIVARLKEDLQKVLVSPQDDPDPIEMWDTTEADLRHWESQRALLQQRVQRASDIYDDLARRAGQMKSR